MSFLHRVDSTYGRLVPKPENDERHEEIFDEVVPIQDQIENLRTKIALKERYNRALTEEFEAEECGASSILQDLYYETRDLRMRLMAAIMSERGAVQNALRTHRQFQLAMTGSIAPKCITWLDDKLFDITKQLNSLLDHLSEKRKKLEEAERMVLMIEKWPRPGSLPWEVEALEVFHRLENRIENTKVKRETAFILHSKYHEIKFLLREERGKYIPTLRALETQLNVQRNELRSLQTMMDEANTFRDESGKNLILTEKESSENRKVRRKQMTKMKKAVEKVLSDNHTITMPVKVKRNSLEPYDKDDPMDPANVIDILKAKREEVERYEVRSKRLVEIMRVVDLTRIPIRYKTVRALGRRLKLEEGIKEEMRNRMIKQRDQLMLILNHFQYSGRRQEAEFQKREKEFEDALGQVEADLTESGRRLQQYGSITVDLRLSMLAVLERLDEKAHHHEMSPDLKVHMKAVYIRLKRLMKSVEHYEQLFQNKEPERNYAVFTRQPTIQPRHVRVGSPIESDESDAEDDDDMPDMKVPGRLEIKLKSQRVIQQAILKRGLR